MQLADFERTSFIEVHVLSIAYAYSLYVRESSRCMIIGIVMSTSETRSKREPINFEAVLPQVT